MMPTFDGPTGAAEVVVVVAGAAGEEAGVAEPDWAIIATEHVNMARPRYLRFIAFAVTP
jgi:hypothetical protein